ncbi:uncharacterized protein [Nicotiana sylvestris]|uniref:Uncharacterized protein LOC104231781 isoform X4 n=1 Tax=Nicotiana sylvestris TaxID=4096 RepID=A0A1U7WX12_NICSY|nr:PREDICTED: uncharacterized protein LOC104231781 isoform X4 [Nicotiana sylvestris]
MPIKGGDVLERLPNVPKGISEIDASLVFGEISRLCEQAKALYSQTFTRYQAEVTCHEREKAHLTEQFEKEGALLRKELWAKESKVSELKRHVREITYKRDTLQEKREDAIVTSAQAGRVLEEAEMKLTLAMECAQL